MLNRRGQADTSECPPCHVKILGQRTTRCRHQATRSGRVTAVRFCHLASMTNPLHRRSSAHGIDAVFFGCKPLFPSCPSVDLGRLTLLLWSIVRSDFRSTASSVHRVFMEETSNVYPSPHAGSVLSGTTMHRRDGEFGRVGRRTFVERQWMLVHSTASTTFGRSLPVPLIRFNIRVEGPTVDRQCHFTRPPKPRRHPRTQLGRPGVAARANNSGLTGRSCAVGRGKD